MLYTQFWAPVDGRKNGLKHVEHLTEINKLWNVASCWLNSADIITECFVRGCCQIEASSHNATACHKIGKRNTQNKFRPKHSYDGNELELYKTKLIYYSCSAISHAYTMCHLHMWLPLQTFILNRISTVMSLLDRFLCIRSPRHVTGKNGFMWRGLSTIWQGWFWLRSDKNYKNSHLQYTFEFSHRVKSLVYFDTSYTGTFSLPEYVICCGKPCEKVSLIYPFHTAIERANDDKADHVMNYTKPSSRRASPTDG